MFREFKQVKQERTEGHRRWFEADGVDLIVWYDRAGGVSGFQLCYDIGNGEHALTWRPGGGCTHSRVDAGEGARPHKMTPILVADGAVPWARLLGKFNANSTTLEPALRTLVRDTLAAHAKA